MPTHLHIRGKNMKYNIIPEPLKMSQGDEIVFTLTRLCEVEYDEGSKKAYDALVKFLSDSFSMELVGTGREKITLKIDENIEKTIREAIISIGNTTEKYEVLCFEWQFNFVKIFFADLVKVTVIRFDTVDKELSEYYQQYLTQ